MLNQILHNFQTYSSKEAFIINEKTYSYQEFESYIGSIFEFLKNSQLNKNEIVPVIINHDVETYASVFAIWFAGGTFLPINPKHPIERNKKILSQVDCNFFLSSSDNIDNFYKDNEKIRYTNKLSKQDSTIANIESDPTQILYIIFTSGSTGNPKGVQISLENLQSFMDAFLAFGYDLYSNDKFLQIYDLSFDASFHCYVLPMYIGASVFPVNPTGVKYLEAIKLLQKHKLTFAKMPPSTLNFLKPYFSSIQLPELRYSLFGGEALPEYLIPEWQKCVPNAEIHNVYGPTEVTINCLYFKCAENLKSYNGVVSVGKYPSNLKAIIVDEKRNILAANQKGELCFAGNQVTPGYLDNKEKNKQSFFLLDIDGKTERFYRTGDLAFYDENGDYFYYGRIDNQVQIQGYRVELGEIESAVREITGNANNVVLYIEDKDRSYLTLLLEKYDVDEEKFKAELVQKVPSYMVPRKILNLPQFPLNENGKTDRNKLKEMILKYD